jgi:hypothetical protein
MLFLIDLQSISHHSHAISQEGADVTQLISRRGHAFMLLRLIIVLLSLLPGTGLRPASAAPRWAASKCVLACDTRLRQCSMYSPQEVTSRLVVVEFMPYDYKRVYSNSLCERRVCARRSSTCYLIP